MGQGGRRKPRRIRKVQQPVALFVFFCSFLSLIKKIFRRRSAHKFAPENSQGVADPRPHPPGLRPRVWGLGSGHPRGGGRRNPAPPGHAPSALTPWLPIVPRLSQLSRVRGSIFPGAPGKISTPGGKPPPLTAAPSGVVGNQAELRQAFGCHLWFMFRQSHNLRCPCITHLFTLLSSFNRLDSSKPSSTGHWASKLTHRPQG